MRKIALLFFLVCLSSESVWASDQQRESEFAEMLRSPLTDGDQIWLQAGQQRFLALKREADFKESAGVAILLHDMGEHPDQKQVMHALRTILPRHRWTTLALQMPLREAGAQRRDYFALFDEADKRLQAAISYLHQNDQKHLALVGYGLGAMMAVDAIDRYKDDFVGLVTISLPIPESHQQIFDGVISKLELPYLDIFAEYDWSETTDTANHRKLIAKKNDDYRQVKIDGDTHAYTQSHELLVKRIYSWLSTLKPKQ